MTNPRDAFYVLGRQVAWGLLLALVVVALIAAGWECGRHAQVRP
jgi:hypothetical protein